MTQPLTLNPPRVLEVSRAVTGVMTARWEEMMDGRRLGHTLNLRGRTLVEARREVGTIWPGNWEWSNGRGRRVERL